MPRKAAVGGGCRACPAVLIPFIFNGNFIRYEPFPVKVVDINGAGDTFHGAFLAGRVRGMELIEAVNFASAAAAIKCRGFGARESIPSYDEMMDFIKGVNV